MVLNKGSRLQRLGRCPDSSHPQQSTRASEPGAEVAEVGQLVQASDVGTGVSLSAPYVSASHSAQLAPWYPGRHAAVKRGNNDDGDGDRGGSISSALVSHMPCNVSGMLHSVQQLQLTAEWRLVLHACTH